MSSNELSSLIERARNKLLDLTNRNRLLNYPKNRTTNRLILIDELPNQLYSTLVDNNTPMLLKSIPMPTAKELEELGLIDIPDVRERAISIGLNPSYIAPLQENEPTDNHLDNYIQTLHYPKDMDRILGRLYSEAREIIEETGANMLYLVMGFLEWNDYKDNTKRFAPLIMIPVQLEKGSLDNSTQTYQYKLLYTDEDIVTNLALKVKLQRDIGILLPELEEGMTPEEYFSSFNTLLNNNPLFKLHREFALDFLKFSKILMYLDLDPSRWPEDKSLLSNDTLQNIFLNNSDVDVSLASDYPIDQTKEADEIDLIVDADSSQHSAIIDVHKGKNLVIEGPPGTGKSQTITNIIADAISQGKKILFVAEKLAALDVVKSRLEEAGLGDFCLELHSHKSHKQRVYQDLASRMNRPFVAPMEINSKLNELKYLKSELNIYASLLAKKHENSGLTFQQILGNAELNRMTKINFSIMSNADTLCYSDIVERCNSIKTITSFLSEHPEIINSAWTGYSPYRAIKLDATEILKLWEKYTQETRGLYEIISSQQFTELCIETLEDINLIVETANKPFFQSMPNDDAISKAYNLRLENPQSLLENILRLTEKYESLPTTNFDMFVDDSDLKRLEIAFLEHKNSNWLVKLLNQSYRDAKRRFSVIFPNSKIVDAQSILRDTRLFIGDLREFHTKTANNGLREFAVTINTCIDPEFTSEKTIPLVESLFRLRELETVLTWVNEFSNTEIKSSLKELAYSGRASYVKDSIDLFVISTEKCLRSLNSSLLNIVKYGQFDHKCFYGSQTPTLQTITHKNISLEENSHEMGEWIEYCRNLEAIVQYGLGWIIDAIKSKQITLDEAEQAFKYSYYQTLALSIMRENPELGGFSRQAHEQKIKNFQALDLKIIGHKCQHIQAKSTNVRCPAGVQTGKVATLTEMGLLKNEIRKRTKHVPIRSALLRAPLSIQALKPCFMMSPMSCSQYLAPGKIEFDLIVMDEASQIRPEDALGAIIRAKQVVVVGDPKQLPPTAFFDRKFNENDDDDQTIVDDSESILDVCLKAFNKPRQLSWHYRSQHESLIAFSNQQFYEGKLMLFPSPKEPGIEYGIKRHYIEDGCFINQYNIEEAKAIVNAIVEYFRSGKTESLGVVAMNINQTRYITGLFEDACRKDPSLDTLVARAGENGNSFFIKNLENVQGDERDVIFVSTTYGPDQSGHQRQIFGAINQDSGWRRLNVLITRAKKRIELFTSILSSNIIISPNTKEGVIAFKGYLKFAETNILQSVIPYRQQSRPAEPESPFEEAVASIIVQAGYEVALQVGAAGYFIDIAVKHPDNPSEYLLAVECDGATYHSSLSARDRDRLKTAVLQKMGWDVHRIWSTDWFNNRGTEISRLLNAIEIAKNSRPVIVSHVSKAKSTQIETIDKHKSQNNRIVDKIKTLEEQLAEFRDNIIAQHYTIDEHCLLSNQMIQVFSYSKPTSKQEFKTKIPEYMRTNINPEQMEFIDDILEIVESY